MYFHLKFVIAHTSNDDLNRKIGKDPKQNMLEVYEKWSTVQIN